MKASAITRIVIYSLVIVILLGILVAGFGIGYFVTLTDWNHFLSIDLVPGGTTGSSGAVQADTVKNLHIEWASGSITIQPGDTDQITFSEPDGIPEDQQMVWSQSGDKLTIQYCKSAIRFPSFGINASFSKDLVITVPRDWDCGSLEIDAASADVKITGLQAQEADFDGASAVCTFEDCQVEELNVDTASGDVQFSGSLNVLDFDAASAGFTAVLTNTPSQINLKTVSGGLDITLPGDCGFRVELDSLSGRFSSDFPTSTINGSYLYGDESCRIKVSAVSGDVVIRNGNEP